MSNLHISASLKAGAARVDITPPAGVPMWGFAKRASPATGSLDPLFARVLVLEAGEKRLALVTLDSGRAFGPAPLAQMCRKKVSAIAEFQEAVEINHGDAQGYYHLAKAYRRAGEAARGIEALEKFSQIKVQRKEEEGWEVLFHIAR